MYEYFTNVNINFVEFEFEKYDKFVFPEWKRIMVKYIKKQI